MAWQHQSDTEKVWVSDEEPYPEERYSDEPPICNGFVCPFPNYCECEREAALYDDYGDED
jgi:hypothetical protein